MTPFKPGYLRSLLKFKTLRHSESDCIIQSEACYQSIYQISIPGQQVLKHTPV